MTVTGVAVLAGVVGWPVTHSLSPVLHNAWISFAGLDAAYVPFAVRPEGFRRWLEGLRAGGGVRGLNVTMPYKAQALEAADDVSEAARLAGGANRLVFGDGGAIEADSTDGAGVLAAFAEQAPGWRAEAGPAVVFGAGGAGGAMAYALVRAGAPQVRVVARDRAKAARLCAPFPTARAFAWDEAATALRDATAVLNATPLGFRGLGELDLPWNAVPPGAVVMDAVMSPLETPLLCAARARGHVTVDGLAMLIGQARPSFEAFFGRPPPPEVDVRARALGAIAARERGG